MRTVSVVGARPQFVKLAPVSRAMADSTVTDGAEIDDTIVHTGQHYDSGMSDVFFDELDIPTPGVRLGIGSGSHGVQTGKMLAELETTLLDCKPDLVVTYGDTNSTLAATLAATKLHLPVAHVEAGLRSFNRLMPEEINRIASDHVSDLLLAPTATAMQNLANENLQDRSVLTGDVMLDAVRFNARLAEQHSQILSSLNVEQGNYAIATIHRPSTTDSDDELLGVLDALNRIATDWIPVVFPVHPRTAARIEALGSRWSPASRLRTIDPLGYLDLLALLNHARLAMTDSGGLQKEALFVDTPCVTLREETEWVETVEVGGNVLVGAVPERILAAVERWLGQEGSRLPSDASLEAPFGEGDAAQQVVRAMLSFHRDRSG